ncbi:MAG: GAF domain-containing protein, partial [Myxococcales bacterium]|nr:GAF domain-containing protein [Myxococcales bacterium]
TEAVERYEQARAGAARFGRAYVEGIACTRLADLAARRGWTATADGALDKALAAYERWGAWAVVRALEGRRGPVLETQHGEGSEGTTGSSDKIATLSHPGTASQLMTRGLSLDMAALLATMQTISEDLRLEEVITRVLGSAIESAGADRGLLLLERDGELAIVAEGNAGEPCSYLASALPLSRAGERLPSTLVNYVTRTRSALVIDDAGEDPRFASDPYILDSGVRSLLGLTIVKQRSRVGVLLLENRLQADAFSEQRLQAARMLMAQAANALDNARLYAELSRSEAAWRSLVDGVPDIISLLDEQGRIEFINHPEIHDFSRGELSGMRADQMLDEDSSQLWRETLA